MYRIVIQTGAKEKPTLELMTDSKGKARSIAEVCYNYDVGCEVLRETKEVQVRFSFDKPTPAPVPKKKDK